MGSYELEWLTFIVRWLHVIVGAVWIGTSFYLFSWENKFNRKALKEGIEGNFWTIQGGDFYYVEKLKQAPRNLPEELHWFKYEAYLTWVTGFSLLCIIFYISPSRVLINPDAVYVSSTGGVIISIASLVTSWIIYNLYCKTRFAENLPLSAALGIVAVATLAYFFSTVFTGRATFLHVGAVMGTIMSANVFFIIIPWHKALIRAIKNNNSIDALYENHPGIRSDHNHYMALPVFLIMLSGHLPVAFNHPYSWVILAAMALAAGFIKHFHTKLQQRKPSFVYLAIAIVLFMGVVFASQPSLYEKDRCSGPISFDQVYSMVSNRCSSCHSAIPSDRSLQNPPNGVAFDTPQQIFLMRDRIIERTVNTQTMPPANKTGMIPKERELLECWVKNGASVN